MTTQISAKFAALGIALMMNVAMMGAIAYIFNARSEERRVGKEC